MLITATEISLTIVEIPATVGLYTVLAVNSSNVEA